MLQCYRMSVIHLLCLASLLALVVFSGTAEPSALADVWGGEEPPVTTEAERCAEDENRQKSVGTRITLTGISDDTDDQAREDTAGIAITMTGDEQDGARASVTLVARCLRGEEQFEPGVGESVTVIEITPRRKTDV